MVEGHVVLVVAGHVILVVEGHVVLDNTYLQNNLLPQSNRFPRALERCVTAQEAVQCSYYGSIISLSYNSLAIEGTIFSSNRMAAFLVQ